MPKQLGLEALAHLEETTGRGAPINPPRPRQPPPSPEAKTIAHDFEKRKYSCTKDEFTEALAEIQGAGYDSPPQAVSFHPKDQSVRVRGETVLYLVPDSSSTYSFEITFLETPRVFVNFSSREVTAGVSLPTSEFFLYRACAFEHIEKAFGRIAERKIRKGFKTDPLTMSYLVPIRLLREKIRQDPLLQAAGIILTEGGHIQAPVSTSQSGKHATSFRFFPEGDAIRVRRHPFAEITNVTTQAYNHEPQLAEGLEERIRQIIGEVCKSSAMAN